MVTALSRLMVLASSVLFSLLIVAAPSAAPPAPAMVLAQTQSANFGTQSIGQLEFELKATGGDGNYAWSLASGTLPPGMSIRSDKPSFFSGSASAALSGVATTPGTYNFTLRVTSSAGAETADQASTMKITALAAQNSSQLPDAFVGTAYSYTLTAVGAAGPLTYSPIGSLASNPGVTLAANGVLSGTPTTAGSNLKLDYEVSDGTDTVFKSVNLNVSTIRITTAGVLPNATQNVAYSTQIAATGGTGVYTWSASGLPSGFSIGSSSGVISGTSSSSPSKFSITVTAKESTSSTSYSKKMSIALVGNVVALPTVTPPSSGWDDCTIGSPCNRDVMSGGVAPFTWTASGLPAGMTFRTGSGVTGNNTTPGDLELWGAPTQTGTFNVQVEVTDANNAKASNTFPLRVSVMAVTSFLNSGTLNTAYSGTLRVIGGTPARTVALTGGTLLSGLSVDTNTLVISGTPVESGSSNPQFTFTDAVAQTLKVSSFFSINGAGSGVSINTNANLGSTTTNSSYGNTLNGSGGTLTWTVVTGPLPTGLTLSSSGSLSGTPTVSGVSTFLVKADAGSGNFAQRQFTLNVTPMSITTSPSLPFGNVGTAYSQSLVASGGTGATTWTLNASNYLPPGLTLASNGTLSGTPTATGQFNFTVTAADTAAHNRTVNLNLSIYPAGQGPPLGQTQSANFGTQSIGQVQQELRATGGDGNYAWSLLSGTLPPGLSVRPDKPSFFNSAASAGIIGVATTPGTYSFVLRVTSGAQTADQASTMKITALTSKDPTLPDAFVGIPYSYQLAALGNAGSTTWSSASNVPAGLTLSPGGLLSGTPTSPFSNTSIQFTMSDGVDSVGKSASLTVYAVRINTSGNLPNATPGVAYSTTIVAAGGTGPYTFSGFGFPNGLSLNSSTGAITGTPTGSSGFSSVSVTATDSTSASYTKRMSLNVLGPASELPALAPDSSYFDCTLGSSCSRVIHLQSGTGPFTWGVPTNLPPGMSLRIGSGITGPFVNAGDAELWGTPTAAGTFNVGVSVSDGNGNSVSNVFPLKVSTISKTSFGTNGTLSAPYSQVVRVIGGTLPYSAALTTGYLPSGVTLNGATLALSGTPVESGSFSPLYTFTDAASQTLLASEFFSISNAGTGVSINTSSDLGATFTGSSYSKQLSASGSSLTWTQTGGTLPTGVTLSAGGLLSGTPSTSGLYTFLIKAADSGGTNFSIRQFRLTVTTLTITSSSSLPNGNMGAAYSQALTATGGTGAITWSLAPINYLPPGITLAANGTLSGTPTSTGKYNFTVRALDTTNTGRETTITVSVFAVVNTAPTISTIAAQTTNFNTATPAIAFTVGDAETAAASLTVSGSSSNTTLVPNANIVFGGSGASRTVTVTPATDQSGTATITVTVSDGSLSTSTTFALTVNPKPTVSLDRTSLSFAATSSGTAFTSQTAAQAVHLSQTTGTAVTWTAASNVPWLVVSPTSGSGGATLTVSVQFAAALAASQTGSITLTFTGAANTAGPIGATLAVSTTPAVSPPFGVFDTPAGDATVLAGSVAVTGWALDNVGVKRLELWRDLVAGETTPPFASTPTDPRNGKVFISNATFVDNARPDVEALNPNVPFKYRAGWGYLLLTWGLWNQGNGTYKLYAFAFDQEDNVATIGTKTIIVSNTAAVKPFGSIDTPGIGAEASGPNFGWALTPKVNGVATCKIQSNGAQVSIDSGPLQPVHYGDLRTDIQGAFPGFSNSNDAGGNYLFDWSTLANGTHTIGWYVTDDCNRADGIGSRFFQVSTGTNQTTGVTVAQNAVVAVETESSEPITVAYGYGELPVVVPPGDAGSRTVDVKQMDRVEIRVPSGFDTAYQLGTDGERRALPTGATWDATSGTLSWQPAPGFLGRYRIVFSNGTERISVRVNVVAP